MDDLLWRQGFGPFSRLNSPHYSPKMTGKVNSIPHSPRYDRHNPRASQTPGNRKTVCPVRWTDQPRVAKAAW